MKPKKKFSETKVGIFLKKAAPHIFKITNSVMPSTGVLGLLKGLIQKDDTLPQQDKDIALKLLEQDISEMQEITKRWEADSKSGWLAANVRPITLMFFSVSYVIGWYLEYPLDSITGLLSLIVGAYFGSRGVEKIMGNNKHK